MSAKFPELPWYEVAERVGRATFRLYTDKSMGTGFLLLAGSRPEQHIAVLATAYHVVDDVVTGTTMRVCDQTGREVVRSAEGNIAITEIGNDLDCALLIVTSKTRLFSEDLLLPILPTDAQLRRGAEIGWMGYPGIVEPELCFFQGHVAGMLRDPPVYLVDGIAINGVSGGPVFDNRCHLVGLVSAYLPNKVADNLTLPGVSWMVPINFIYAWVTKFIKPRDRYAPKYS
jgi:Trypsin-like peptidase domain